MSMTSLSQDERVNHAKRALAQFKTMIDTIYRPLLQAVTKNRKLKVEPTATVTATDGKTVYLMVPWVLGETREHDHLVCNKRDEHTLHMLCPACDVKDQIASSVFHESAHITSESFVPVDMEKVRPMVSAILPFLDIDPDALPAHHKGLAVQAMQVMTKIESVYLPQIFNVVEDIYVNRRLYEHRAGVETSMKRLTLDVFTGGFTQGHGNAVKWDERPVSAQAAMVAYLLGTRLPHLVDHLSDEVQVVRDDQAIIELMEDIPGDCEVEVRIETAFRVFARLRELGFCVPPSKREPEPEPEPPKGGEPDPDMPQDPPQPSGDGEEDGPEGQPGDESKPEGDGEGDDEDDAQSEGSGGKPDEKDEESDEKGDDAGEGESDESEDKDDGDVGLGTEGDEDEARDGDFDEEGDDHLNKGDGEPDDEGDQDLPSGSGEANEDGDPMDEDDGQAGKPTPDELDQQEAKEMAEALGELMGHELPDDPVTEPEEGFKPHPEANDPEAKGDLERAIKWQKFDEPPEGVTDFYEEEGDPSRWNSPVWGEDINFDPGIVSGETARLRAVFAQNRKTRMTGSLKSGPRLDVPNLHRIGQEDYRIFGKKDRPGKRDWFVLVGLDDSGSTHGTAEHFIREMGLAVGEMLQGTGVKFAMYGHGGTKDYTNGGSLGPDQGGWAVRHLVIKGPDEPWSPEVKSRLKALCRDDTCNYDGHTMEQYRKIIEKRRETDKMILYLTDGKMPMMNFDEEERVLKRELQILRQRRVNLFGVGYRTDSPKQHGMDTIVVQDSRDLPTLVNGLRERLEK